MIIKQQAYSEIIILALEGELDANSSSVLDEALQGVDVNIYTKVLINCASLTYISSAGLGVFISNLKRLDEARIKLVFYNMKAKISNVFGVLGLDTLLTIVPTEAEALSI